MIRKAREPTERLGGLPDEAPARLPILESLNTTRLDRRGFLRAAAVPCLLGGTGLLAGLEAAPRDDSQFIREARHYEKQPHKKIKCVLCPRECVVDDRERGYCGARENRGGTYYTLVYSRAVSAHVDPIEKKPFFHFLPGTTAFSVATAGCNVNCKMCQNWEISQVRPEQVDALYLPPQKLAQLARDTGCAAIAYTYSEPVIFYEWMYDCAKASRPLGIKNVVVTGGYIKEKPLRELCKVVDAIKVDLKAFSEKYYREIVNGELKPVLDALVVMKSEGVWTEIVYLVVPTLNDKDDELRGLARWVKSNLGPDVPVHFSRFYPQYLLKNLPPTPLKTLERAKQIADSEGLHYVYIGNVPGHPAENTYCPSCKRAVVERTGYTIRGIHLNRGRCKYCHREIPGVWKA